jgi:peptide/nickel transport system substrate-binding protein
MMQSTRQRWVGPAAVAVLLALVALGCSSTGTDNTGNGNASGNDGSGVVAANPEITIASQGKPQVGGRLTYGIEAESDGFDPTKNRWAISGVEIAMTVYDPLFAFDDTGTPQPYALAKAVPSADYKTWTATLRPGLVFHDGTAANSQSLKTQVEAFHSSTLTAPAFRPYKDSKIIDDLTLEIQLSTPWAAFPNLLTAQGGALVAPAVFANPNGNREPVGTGPFKFVEWKTDDHLQVTRNDKYWMKDADGQQLPYLNDIVFKPIADSASRKKALESGDVNIVHENHAQQLTVLRDEAKEGKLQYVPDTGEKEETYVLINAQQPPLDDPILRRALYYATNQQDYLDVTVEEKDQGADSPFEPSSKWYSKDAGFPTYNVEKAKELIAEYKKKHGDGPITFKLGTTNTAENAAIVQKLQDNWKVIGVDAKLETIEQIQIITQAVTATYDTLLFRQFGSVDPDGDYHFWAPINSSEPKTFGLNFSRLKDDQLQKDLDTVREEADFTKRKAAMDDAQKRLADQVPYIFLDHVQWVIVADTNVRNIGNNLLPDADNKATGKALRFATGTHRLTTTWLAS